MNILRLFSTFLIWFLTWNLFESIMNYYKWDVNDKLKYISIAALFAWYNYYENYSKDESEDKE